MLQSESSTKKARIVTCNYCGHAVGEEIDLAGKTWLRVGGVIVNHMRGVCSVCGEEFYWSFSEVMLAQLVKHVLISRVDEG